MWGMPFMYLIVDENQTNGGDPSGEFTESCHVKKLIAYWKHHTHTHTVTTLHLPVSLPSLLVPVIEK